MDKDYIQTLLSEKMKGMATLTKKVRQVFEKICGYSSESYAHDIAVIKQQLGKLQDAPVDFTSVETTAESIEQTLQVLIHATSMIETVCTEMGTMSSDNEAQKGVNEDKLQKILLAKILKFRNGSFDNKQLTPIVYFGGEKDMSIYDIILGFSEDLFAIRGYIHNIFYGLRDGEFPYRYIDDAKSRKG